jgi:hypothetical protein
LAKGAYPAPLGQEAWVRSPPTPTHKTCLLSAVGDLKLSLVPVSTLFIYTGFKKIISTYFYFNVFKHFQFNVFQLISTRYFNHFNGLKSVEIRNLFQRYFNVILTSGFTDVAAGPPGPAGP